MSAENTFTATVAPCSSSGWARSIASCASRACITGAEGMPYAERSWCVAIGSSHCWPAASAASTIARAAAVSTTKSCGRLGGVSINAACASR